MINEAIADAMLAVEEANEREKENVSPPSKKGGKKNASPGKAKARMATDDVEMKVRGYPDFFRRALSGSLGQRGRVERFR